MTPPSMQRSGTVVDARMSLAMWLRAGRSQRNMRLEDVARVTKIQVRILESGAIKSGDGMPAEVFVRGFVRSIAKCLGLDEAEALRRYTEAAAQAALDGSHSTPATASARAFVESMSELAPQAARTSSPRLLATAPTFAAGSLADLPRAEEIAPAAAPAIDESFEIDVASLEPATESTASMMDEPSASASDIAASSAAIEIVESAAPSVEASAIGTGSVETGAVETSSVEPAAIEAAVETTDGKKKKSKKGTGKGRKRKAIATGTPSQPMPIVAAPTEIATSTEVASTETAPSIETAPSTEIATATAVDASDATSIAASEIAAEPTVSAESAPNTDAALAFATFVARNPSTDATDDVSTIAAIVSAVDSTEDVPAGEAWAPKMPAVVAPTVPWRLAASAQSLQRSKSSTARIVPSLVIDDSDPDLAEREIEDRAAARSDSSSSRRSFLPPILMDREDRTARQGGLTLAVIILLIAATLTLSYLMRRPSSSGDGVTQADLVESVDHLA